MPDASGVRTAQPEAGALATDPQGRPLSSGSAASAKLSRGSSRSAPRARRRRIGIRCPTERHLTFPVASAPGCALGNALALRAAQGDAVLLHRCPQAPGVQCRRKARRARPRRRGDSRTGSAIWTDTTGARRAVELLAVSSRWCASFCFGDHRPFGGGGDSGWNPLFDSSNQHAPGHPPRPRPPAPLAALQDVPVVAWYDPPSALVPRIPVTDKLRAPS